MKSRTNKCPIGSLPFEFELPQHTHNGLFIHTLLITGFGCKKAGYWDADVDHVFMDSTDVKPLLEINGGMVLVDQAATDHVKDLFRNKLKKVA